MYDPSEDITEEFTAVSDTAEYPAIKTESWRERHFFLSWCACYYPLVFVGYLILGHHHDPMTLLLGTTLGGTMVLPIFFCGYIILYTLYREVFKGDVYLDSLPSGHWRQVVEANNPNVTDRRYEAPVGS